MNNHELDANEAIGDLLDLIAEKEKENAMLRLNVASLMRKVQRAAEEVGEGNDDTIHAG